MICICLAADYKDHGCQPSGRGPVRLNHELVTAIELYRMPVTLVEVDTLLELIFVEERHDLNEDCFSFVHGLRMAS